MDALKDNDWRSLDSRSDLGTLMQCKVISWDLTVLSRNELLKFLVRQVKIKRARVIKVVISSIFMLVVSQPLVEHIQADHRNLILECS